MPNPNTFAILEGLGYDPVDIESDADYLRALKESIITLSNSSPRDPRISILQDAVKGLRQAKSKKEAAKSGGKLRAAKRRKGESVEDVKAKIDAKEKAKAFITGKKPEALPPAGDVGGGSDMSSVLAKISGDVNIIKGIVASQNKLDKDKADDTREAREKSKRKKAENMLETSKFKKVANVIDKALAPVKGIFARIFDFLKLFLFGAAVMKLLDWFGNSDNKGKIESIFKFLKDWWPVLVAGLMALFPGVALIPGIIALTVGFLPKLIDTVKSILGFNKQVDKEIKNQEKDYEKNERGVAFDTKLPEDDTGEVKAETSLKTTGKETDGKNLQQLQSFNQGGEVSGQGNEDTVPAMLTPGEFVLTKDAVNQVGADTLYGMNAAAGGTSKPKSGKTPTTVKKNKMKTSTVGTMMNMGGLKMGGMTNNMSYMGKGGVVNNMSYMGEGGMANVQYMKMGGMVKNIFSKSPQARALRFARDQVRKSPVGAPLSKLAAKIPKLEFNIPNVSGGSNDIELKDEIPSFSVTAPGGTAKEQTLGIRR